ncbi:hypothetical protein [Maritimibacter sp. DP1N21-5]|uniref:hypothetical protein n=1 Tax=Maritimibacter sp. DP1N21-5 TaxID=2836867 RepID=UPI001C465CA7|nr:hypothetical protein [Maritimibacter sp. DP1N21-5]MBV7409776.1 hypothetical protein [Maritimibacter sp. DP1N21-5]
MKNKERRSPVALLVALIAIQCHRQRILARRRCEVADERISGYPDGSDNHHEEHKFDKPRQHGPSLSTSTDPNVSRVRFPITGFAPRALHIWHVRQGHATAV